MYAKKVMTNLSNCSHNAIDIIKLCSVYVRTQTHKHISLFLWVFDIICRAIIVDSC